VVDLIHFLLQLIPECKGERIITRSSAVAEIADCTAYDVRFSCGRCLE